MGIQLDRFFVWVLVILCGVPGVHGAGTEVGLIVAGVVVGVLVLSLILAVSFIYFLRSSKSSKKQKPKKRPERVVNGYAKHIPNGNTMRGTLKGPYRVPQMMPGPMPVPPGTYRGPPPVFAPTFSRHSRPMPAMPFYNPYFFQSYGRQIIYVDSSSSESDEMSVRSTVKEKKKRYRRSFLNRDLTSSVVIKGNPKRSAGTPRRHASPREEKASQTESTKTDIAVVSKELDEAVGNEETNSSFTHVKEADRKSRSRSRSRGRGRSRSKSRSPSPVDRTEDFRQSRKSTHNEAPNLTSGFFTRSRKEDIAFVPISSYRAPSPEREPTPSPPPKPEPPKDPSPPPSPPVRRTPSPVPGPSYSSEYQYASAIRPPENPLSITSKSSWGEIDDDIRQNRTAPSNPLRMSMSDRMMGIVEDGYRHQPSELDRADTFEYPPNNSDLGKSRKEEDVYAVSLRRSSKRPSTPPNDYTPRNSQNLPVADYNDDNQRPRTPPFDGEGLTPRQSFKDADSGKPHGIRNNNDILKNQVLMEMKSRLRSNDSEDDHSNSQAPTRPGYGVNFNSDPEIIPRSNRGSGDVQHERPPSPPPMPTGFIPPPPPPPPLPGQFK